MGVIWACFLLACLLQHATSQQEYDLNVRLSVQSNSTNITSNTAHLLDGDNATVWVSEEGIDSVYVSLNPSKENGLIGFTITNIYLSFHELPPPQALSLTLTQNGIPGYIYASTFATDCNDIMNCTNYQPNQTEVSFELAIPNVSEIAFILEGFQSEVSLFRIDTITVRGTINDGYYVPGPQSLRIEGEDGMFTNNGYLSSDSQLFPSYSGRGFVILNVINDIKGNWSITIDRETQVGNLVARYRNTKPQSAWLLIEATYGNEKCRLRFYFVRCDHDNCFSTIESDNNLPINCASFLPGDIVTLSSESISDGIVLLDYISGVSDACAMDQSFVDECNVFESSPIQYNDSCTQQAIQQCMGDDPLKVCECEDSSDCNNLGGDCNCTGPFLGQNCDQCPVYHYPENNTCLPCGCSDGFDCGCLSCVDGQCDCPEAVDGRLCDVCTDGYFESPGNGCIECNCSVEGSAMSCDSITGECMCKNNVTGDDCSECANGYFNFTSDGCTDCNCNVTGSESIDCDDEGQCDCTTGYVGMDCSNIDIGYFEFNNSVYFCDCSNQSLDCTQNPNIMDMPSEICTCPDGYEGFSCQTCSDGYYELDGDCDPCNCPSSVFCNKTNGDCFVFPVTPPPIAPPPPLQSNCTNNTAGDYCDRCAEGYYNSSTNSAQLICTQCPCDMRSAANESCFVVDSVPQCYCLEGHEAPLCDSCFPGYYGNPPELLCQACECSGNIDPSSDPDACNRTTGDCLNCLNNSTGSYCGECIDGFYGNATKQDCKSCTCYEGGTQTCDNISGECKCLVGVDGDTCSICIDGYWNFVDYVGCQSCNCSSIGGNGSCDSTNGMCYCKPGVNGTQCDSCMDEFFGFSSSGCQECDCSDGAFNDSCDETTGQCACMDGASTRTCDTCSTLHQVIEGQSGCQPCDGCVITLSDTNDDINDILNVIENDRAITAGLQQADMLDRESYNARLAELNEVRTNAANVYQAASNELNQYSNDINNLNIDIKASTVLVNDLATQAMNSISDADTALLDVTDLLNGLTLNLNQINAISINVANVHTSVQELTVQAENSWANYTSISDYIKAQSFSSDLTNAKKITDMIMENRYLVANRYMEAQEQKEILETLMGNLTELETTFNSLYGNFNGLQLQLSTVENRVLNNTEWAMQLAYDNTTVGNRISNIDTIILSIMEVADQSNMRLNTASDNIAMLQGLLDSDTASGSGYDSDFALPSLIDELEETVNEVAQELEGSLVKLNSSLEYGDNVYQESTQVISILASSLSNGNEAVEAIMDYRSVETSIANALTIAESANSTLQEVSETISGLMAGSLEEDVGELNMTLEYLFIQWAGYSSESASLSMRYSQLFNQVQSIRITVDNGTATLIDLTMKVNDFINTTNMSLPVIQSQLTTSLQCISEANTTYNTIKYETHPKLLSDADELENIIANTTATAIEARIIIEEANETATQAMDEFYIRKDMLEEAESVSNNVSTALWEAGTDLSNLLAKLEEAEAAAESIDVALRFSGNTSASYSISQSFFDSPSTHVSLYFRGDSVTSGTLLSGGGVSLSLVNRHLEWRDGISLVGTANSFINLYDDVWYQVYASSMGIYRYLSVAPLESSDNSFTFKTEFPGLVPTQITGNITIATNADKSTSDYFTGCIDKVIVNGQSLSLLSSMDATATCGPRPAAEGPLDIESGSWCQGQNYVTLPPYDQDISTFTIYIRTFAERAFVFQAEAKNQLVKLVISDGKPLLERLSVDRFTIIDLSSPVFINDGAWHKIHVAIDSNNVDLIVNGNTVSASMNSDGYLEGPVDITIGGLESSSYPSFAGCLRNISIGGNVIELTNTSDRIETSGCPATVTAGNRFMGSGVAVFPSFQEMMFITKISFSFNTDQIAAVLVHLSANLLGDELYISVFQTHVRVDFKNGLTDDTSFISFLSSQDQLNNNYWHTVTFATNMDSLILTVDDEQVVQSVPGNFSGQLLMDNGGVLEVGGVATTPTVAVAVAESFRGCLKDFTINDEFQDFNNAVSLEGVALYGCRGDIQPLPSTTTSPSVVMSSTLSSVIEVTQSTTIMSTTLSTIPSSSPIPTSVILTISSLSTPVSMTTSNAATPTLTMSSLVQSPTSTSVFTTSVSSVVQSTTVLSSLSPSFLPTPSPTDTASGFGSGDDMDSVEFSFSETTEKTMLPASSTTIDIMTTIVPSTVDTISTTMETATIDTTTITMASSMDIVPSVLTSATFVESVSSVTPPITTPTSSEMTMVSTVDTISTASSVIEISPSTTDTISMMISTSATFTGSISSVIPPITTPTLSEMTMVSTVDTISQSVIEISPSTTDTMTISMMMSTSATFTGSISSVTPPITTPTSSEISTVSTTATDIMTSSLDVLLSDDMFTSTDIMSDFEFMSTILTPPSTTTDDIVFTITMVTDDSQSVTMATSSTISVSTIVSTSDVITSIESSSLSMTSSFAIIATPTSNATPTSSAFSLSESVVFTTSEDVSSMVPMTTVEFSQPFVTVTESTIVSTSSFISAMTTPTFVSQSIETTATPTSSFVSTTLILSTTIITTSSEESIVPTVTSSSSVLPSLSTTVTPTVSPIPLLPIGLNGLDDSFLGYSISTIDIESSNVISLVFRTVSSDAVLLYNQEDPYDYLALEIKGGYVHYTYDLGLGPFLLTDTRARYDDDMLHNVTITRDSAAGSLIVDGVVAMEGVSPFDYTQLNTDNILYVGGVPRTLSGYSLFDSPERIPPGALACFDSLTVNGVRINLNNPLMGNGMEECTASLVDHVSFSGNGYAIIDAEYDPLNKYGFELEFRTLQCEGLLLYASSFFAGDHTGLELHNGTVRFIFDNGGGKAAVLVYTPDTPDELCNGGWHKIVAVKMASEGSLVVDDNTPITGGTGLTSLVLVNVDTPLYAGGVPDSIIPRYTILSVRGFNGCLTDVQLITDPTTNTREIVHFPQAVLSSMEDVQLYSCHV